MAGGLGDAAAAVTEVLDDEPPIVGRERDAHLLAQCVVAGGPDAGRRMSSALVATSSSATSMAFCPLLSITASRGPGPGGSSGDRSIAGCAAGLG